MKNRRSTSHRDCTGLTFVELIAVVAILGILTFLVLSRLAKAKSFTGHRSCISNLKNIGLGFRAFASDSNGQYPMQLSLTNGGSREVVEDAGKVWFHFLTLSNELSTPRVVICPEDSFNRVEATTFTTNAASGVGEGLLVAFNSNLNISYFIGVDAHEEKPDMLLAGDRHLTNGGASPFRASQARVGSLGTNHTSTVGAGWDGRLHHGLGNITFGDGSVRQVNTMDLRSVLRTSGDLNNRIAKPD